MVVSMNLTVAVKIIGGFTIIAILLVITSISSLLNLNTVHNSTTEVSELAIPTLAGSNQLTVELTQMGNLALRGYYQEELEPLANTKQAFEQGPVLRSRSWGFSANHAPPLLYQTNRGRCVIKANHIGHR